MAGSDGGNLAVVAPGQYHQGQIRVIGGDGAHDGVQQARLTHHVVIQRAVGFDVADPRTLGSTDAVQRPDLIVQQVFYFLLRAVHGAAAEAGQVRVGRMGTDAYAVPERQAHRMTHHPMVAGMETTGDAGQVDMRHDLVIQAHFPGAEALAHVAVEQ